MSAAALAFIAGLGGGYIKAKDKSLEQERQAAKDAQDKTLFDANMEEIRRKQSDRSDLQNAGATAVARPMQGPSTEEQQAAQDPLAETQPAIGYISGNGTSARGFASQGVAADDAVKQNTPQAQRTRIAALAAQGNVLAGTALTNDMQREAYQMTINEGHRKEANATFDTGIRTALQTKGPDGLAEFMSNSTADGKGGATKFKTVWSPDGKTWQMHQLADDGTTKPIGQSFTNDENGMATAGFMLSRAVPDSEKVKHLLDLKKSDSDEAYKSGSLKIQQQNADTRERYRIDQAENMRAMRGLEASRIAAEKARGGSGESPVWSKDADKQLIELNTSKDEMTGKLVYDGHGAQFMQTLALEKARKNGGNIMAAVAYAADQDNNLKIMAKGDAEKLRSLRNEALAMASNAAAPMTPVAATKPIRTPASSAREGVTPTIQPQQFNTAGYVSVQSTIDGAKRGDVRARALLNDLIAQGATTPSERNQIANLSQ